jgi:hypothetical protein
MDGHAARTRDGAMCCGTACGVLNGSEHASVTRYPSPMRRSRLDPRLRRAVDGSVGWYEDLCALHGIGTRIAAGIWRSAGPPPALHSDVVIVEPSATAEGLIEAFSGRTSWGYKDSFASLAPSGPSVQLLFEATWMHREAPARSREGHRATPWRPLRTAEALARWNAGWDTSEVLLPGLLERGHFAILGRFEAEEIVAGAVARLGSGAVDVSNVHGVDGRAVDWEELVVAIGAVFPDRELVGYERGEDLDAALSAGFAPVGPLRVWIDQETSPG